MSISYYTWDGKPIKQWPNWTGNIPLVGDFVVLHYGDYGEEEVQYRVLKRQIDGMKPDNINLYVIEEL